MTAIRTYNLTTEELEETCNQVKDVFLDELARCSVISKEQVEELSKTKVIIIKRKSTISRFFKKLIGKEEKESAYILVGTLKEEETNGNESG